MQKISELASINNAALSDFQLLGIENVEQLVDADPEELYERLGELVGAPHDMCVLDIFRAAVAEARDPDLPTEQHQWWYWARQRRTATI